MVISIYSIDSLEFATHELIDIACVMDRIESSQESSFEEYADYIALALLPDEITDAMRINGFVAQLLQDCTWDGFHSDRRQVLQLVHDIANGDAATIVEILAALERMEVQYDS